MHESIKPRVFGKFRKETVRSPETKRREEAKFLANALLAHGNSYDYSRMVFKGVKHDVEIVCPAHGPFWQRPSHHAPAEKAGLAQIARGCPTCAHTKRKSKRMFGERLTTAQVLAVHPSADEIASMFDGDDW